MHRKPIIALVLALTACGDVGAPYRCLDGTAVDSLDACRPVDTTTAPAGTCTTGTGFAYTAPVLASDWSVSWSSTAAPSCDVDTAGRWTVATTGGTARIDMQITTTLDDPRYWFVARLYRNGFVWEGRAGCEGCGVSGLTADVPLVTGDVWQVKTATVLCAPPYGDGFCHPWQLCAPDPAADPPQPAAGVPPDKTTGACINWGPLREGPYTPITPATFDTSPGASWLTVTL